jgi:hypothetical protein
MKRAGGVAQGVGPHFKPHYLKQQQKNGSGNTEDVWSTTALMV